MLVVLNALVYAADGTEFKMHQPLLQIPNEIDLINCADTSLLIDHNNDVSHYYITNFQD